MNENQMNDKVIEKYLKAGKILSKVRNEVKDKIKVGSKLVDIADFIENRTIELGGFPAFPCNISRNDEAAHSTPCRDDSVIFGNDMIKIDMGVHVDGYIADSAFTADLLGNKDLVKASEDALFAAIDIIKEGVNTARIGSVIESTITENGFKPIINLSGHSLAQYVTHAGVTIPNKHTNHGTVLKQGDAIAIEPFATDGIGKVVDGVTTEIYSVVANKPIRMKAARDLMKEIEFYKTLPFAKRWLKSKKLDFSLKQLIRSNILRGYPVLKEISGGMVSQAEHTVIVMKDGCEITTI